jgi:hypothetical protein
MNNYQSIYTQILRAGKSFIVDPIYGFTRIEILASKSAGTFNLTGNLLLTSNVDQNKASEQVSLVTPYLISSSGNTPLGGMTIMAISDVSIICYR